MYTPSKINGSSRIVRAVHGCEHVAPDPDFEVGLATALRAHNYQGLIRLYARFVAGKGRSTS
jgi:hypothetical protein